MRAQERLLPPLRRGTDLLVLCKVRCVCAGRPGPHCCRLLSLQSFPASAFFSLGVVLRNGRELSDGRIAVFDVLSRINHSCDPNCIQVQLHTGCAVAIRRCS